MSPTTDSATSSPIKISSNGVAISDPESTSAQNNSNELIEKHKPTEERESFPPGDGDVILCINGSRLETHKHILRKFKQLDIMLSSDRHHPTLQLDLDERGATDFQNAFKILYATVVEGPFEFDAQTLVSALRLSTAYDYPALRAFAIDRLEKIPLGAIERIRLARSFDVTGWEAPAYKELCEREQAISFEEACVLSLDTFVELAAAREKELRRRRRLIETSPIPTLPYPFNFTPPALIPAGTLKPATQGSQLPPQTRADWVQPSLTSTSSPPFDTKKPAYAQEQASTAFAFKLPHGCDTNGPRELPDSNKPHKNSRSGLYTSASSTFSKK